MHDDDIDDDEGPHSRICVDCGTLSPGTPTDFTPVVSSRHGWRLIRVAGRLEWRCPGCWVNYKQSRILSSTPSDGLPRWPDSRAPSIAPREVRPSVPPLPHDDPRRTTRK